jgi:CRP-like cAMP-binding protein
MYSKHNNRFDTESAAMIDDAGLRTHSRYAREILLKPGHTLYHQGDPADLLHEVVRGVVRLERVLLNGRRQVMSFGFAGDIVGFPHDGLHTSTCRMITSGTVISHRADALDRASADPDLHRRVFDAALTEIGVLHNHFQTLGCCSAMERVAGFLAQLSERIGVEAHGQTVIRLPMCRSDIADYLGLSTETISRMVSQLRASNVISLADVQTVVVHDTDKLSMLAEGE